MLYFMNDGQLDMRLAQLFGANVKPNAGAIGHFGTGLKYAIAIVLRHNGRIEIETAGQHYSFRTTSASIRGKEFDLVEMLGPGGTVQMPFTLELGKEWEPWMAYRELYCNAIDEGGFVSTRREHYDTVIAVDCAELEKAHAERHTFILNELERPIWQNAELAIYRKQSSAIFYRGIKALDLDDASSIYTYNLLAQEQLTEDRTLAGQYFARLKIMRAIAQAPESILRLVLTAEKGTFEGSWNWGDAFTPWLSPPEPFTKIVRSMMRDTRGRLNLSLLGLSRIEKNLLPPATSLSRVETNMLARAKQFVERAIGTTVEPPIRVVEGLGDGVYGAAIDGEIVIAKLAFQDGTKMVAVTLLEEWMHTAKGINDYTPRFQHFALSLVMTLTEQLLGEPI